MREGREFQTKDQTAQRRGGVQGGLGSGAGAFMHEGHMKKWVENRLWKVLNAMLRSQDFYSVENNSLTVLSKAVT